LSTRCSARVAADLSATRAAAAAAADTADDGAAYSGRGHNQLVESEAVAAFAFWTVGILSKRSTHPVFILFEMCLFS
jgi:hypothetical protein